ncbi:MAG TPA: UDP-glucose--hexose-1-phosphate uridylyltransferase [Pyrinomonadaceae bacterium]|nr:UDP-glucose--hexose-1-phosphate uridylyltransferase [Pyrinomonadaceae bacterium]
MLDPGKDPHRRYNPLTMEWVLVSPHRTQRPWQGQVEETAAEQRPDYDPECYLCPGNARAGGVRNPAYTSTFVFENDFPALLPTTTQEGAEQGGLLIAQGEPGACRVVCFSPRHSLTISRMDLPDLQQVVDVWIEQYKELGALPFINSVQIFENRGAMMGASNPHPHGQIWANATLPNELTKEIAGLTDYKNLRNSCLLCEYHALEIETAERVVCENEGFLAVVPYWAIWPFETLVISKRHVTGIDQFNQKERSGLAGILKRLTSIYDRLFKTSFPYTMGFHQRPTDGNEHDEFHFHAHFYPPLLRSATVRKFMVGYELLATPQRDITAETAATRLRELDE